MGRRKYISAFFPKNINTVSDLIPDIFGSSKRHRALDADAAVKSNPVSHPALHLFGIHTPRVELKRFQYVDTHIRQTFKSVHNSPVRMIHDFDAKAVQNFIHFSMKRFYHILRKRQSCRV